MALPKSTQTAVIIGGGVIGLSVAYNLAKRKFGRIIILEKGLVGDGSSSRAAGIITGLLWSEPGVLARKKAFELYAELSLDLDGYKFQNVGCLNVFTPKSWPARERLLSLYERCGAPFEILNAAEMQTRWPALTPRNDFIGLFDRKGGYSEPHDYIPALTKRNRELGVDILEHQLVTDFVVRNGRVTGVKTNLATFEGDVVIGTVYSWTLPLIAKLGWRLPVKTFVHQRYVTRPLPLPVNIPAINAHPLYGYVRPAHGNRLLFGAELEETVEYKVPTMDWHMSLTASPEIKNVIVENFRSFTPDIMKTSWETEKVGLLTFSMDNEPILGPVSEFPGFYVAMAFHSGGFAYNPVAGYLMAEYVMDGTTTIDIRSFSPDRFRNPKAIDEYFTTRGQPERFDRRRH